MNPDLPPLKFGDPVIKPRRQQRRGVPDQVSRTTEERRATAKKVIAETELFKKSFNQLPPDQQRAIILKLRHDRYLTQQDLAGTDLTLVGESGENESLVVPKDPQLTKLLSRAEQYQAEGSNNIVKKPGVLTALVSVEVADGKERLSDAILEAYGDLVLRDHVIYEIEVCSFAAQSKSKAREIEASITAIRSVLGNGLRGAIYDIDNRGNGARLMIWSTGTQLKQFVEEPQWRRVVTYFDLRPQFRTFSEVLDGFNVGQVSVYPAATTKRSHDLRDR
jgi:hypothetical protein